MNDLSNKFGLYETLRILFPGFYFSTMSLIIFEQMELNSQSLSSNTLLSSVIYLLYSIIIGLLIYSFDLTKICILKDNLPIAKIKEKYPTFNIVDITKSYFSFYDSLPQEYKARSESYLSLFHFCINSMFVGIIMSIGSFFCVESSLTFLTNIGIFVLSLLTAFILFQNKIKLLIERQLSEYYKSPQFASMNNLNP